MVPRQRYWTIAVLAGGAALRFGLFLAWPADTAYDDHFAPVQHILGGRGLPSAADCWEGYQPPLYYVIAAGTYRGGFGLAQTVGLPDLADAVGRKAIQLVSTIAGVLTLWVCLLILRRAVAPPPAIETLSLSLLAVLPAHVQMSAHASNDALAYLLASAAVWLTLRAADRGWTTRACLVAGFSAGATVLTKGYGLVTAATLLAGLLVMTRSAAQAAHGCLRLRPAVAFIVGAAALGIWPTVRNLAIYEQWHIDNFDLFDTPMRFQPPGRAGVNWRSFRLVALLKHPWVHVAHADSFFTQLYARFWFDYEGFNTTLRGQPGWEAHWSRCNSTYPQWNEQRWRMLLDYRAEDVPRDLAWVARVCYICGLPLTGLVLAGAIRAGRNAAATPGAALVGIHWLGHLGVPVVQTIRLPYFAAMKSAYALCGVSGLPVLLALALDAPRGRWRGVVFGLGALALLGVAAGDLAMIWIGL